MNSSALLHVSELDCVRGERTLFTGLSFSVDEGLCLHIIGANGCGKTSLLRMLCGINRPENGLIESFGHSTHGNERYLSDTAYIGHKDGLKNELTAFENLQFNQRLEGLYDEVTIDTALAKLEILHCADLLAHNLSFGQRRRLAFARLLLAPKKLWILDEPFTGIDVDGRALIEAICVEHLRQKGAIVMTHHQSLANSALSDYRAELHLDQLASKPGLVTVE